MSPRRFCLTRHRHACRSPYTRRVLDQQDGPAILVGHSYGGAVISEAGTHQNVARLAYVTAFAPDQGESVNTLIAGFPQDGPQPPILPPRDGFLLLDRDQFPASFAADLDPAQAGFLADSQVPWGIDAVDGTVTNPAWRHKPACYPVATDDRMIPPAAQHAMAERAHATITEIPGSHAIYVSRPAAVAEVIVQAGRETSNQAASKGE